MNSYTIIEQKETKTAVIVLGTDGIVRVSFKDDVEVTPAEVEENFKAYNDVIKGKKYPFIIRAKSGSADYTPEGLAYAKAHENDWPKLCVALLVKNLPQRLLANFYLKINQPTHLHKVFNNEAEAEQWCLQQISLNNHKTDNLFPIFI